MRAVRFGGVNAREPSERGSSEPSFSDPEESSAWADWSDELDWPVARPAVAMRDDPGAEWAAEADSPRPQQSLEVLELKPDLAWAASRAAGWPLRGL
eukprot:380069-Alexandrium_andersonii.AAC.1